MDNSLKLLMTEEDLHHLRKLSVDMENYLLNVLIPANSSLSGEIRRAIILSKKLKVIETETQRLLTEVKEVLGRVG